jgi:uncharacterized membrane protein YecN with MAPEG domain
MTQSAADSFGSLDDLLQESMQVVIARKELKAARPKLTDQRVGSPERKEIEAKIREWEQASEWKPAAVTAMFLTQVCRCGTQSIHFKGLFQRQSHRTSTLSRWILTSTPAHLNLPKEQKYDTEQVAMCYRCCDSKGFQLPELNVPSAFPNSRTF